MQYWRKLVPGKRLLWPLALLWLVLLPMFSWVQWNWLNRLRDADHAHMHNELTQAASALRDDFDQELADVYNQFRLRDTSAALMSEQFNSQYAEYSARTDHARLVDRIFWVKLENQRPVLMEYLPWENHLAPATWPNNMDVLRENFERQAKGHYQVAPPSCLAESSTLVVPTLSSTPKSWVLITLNDSYLLKDLLAKKAGTHLQVGVQESYLLAVTSQVDKEKALYLSNNSMSLTDFAENDLTVGLFSLRRASLNKSVGQGDQQLMAGNWQLMLKHRSGSLLNAANVDRNVNAAMLFSMMAVLGLSFIGPLLVFQRSKSLLGHQLAYFSGLSHDLRAPLSVISSAAYNLSRNVVSDEKRVKQYGSLIRKESLRLQDMVNQVLEYSRAHAGRASYFMEALSSEELVSTVMKEHAGLLEKHNIELSLLVDKDLPPVWGDVQALKSAVGNLVTNAVKYGGARCWIGVRVFRDGKGVSIEVADRGNGIPLREQSQLFDAYYRAESVRNSDIEGSGLGLEMVKKILTRHGGKVRLRSSPGEGAAFCLSLPPISKLKTRSENGGLLAWKKRFSW